MWQSKDIEANGIKLHYYRTGGEKPALVLLHGITDYGLCWTSVTEQLEADYDVIMLDFRGHGLSSAPDTGYDLSTYAQDVYGVIQALDLQDPVILGHSLGAITALAFAGLYPDSVKAILLEDPPPLWMQSDDNSDAMKERADGVRAWLASSKGKTHEELLEESREQTGDWSATEQKYWAESKLHANPKIADLFVALRADSPDWANLLPEVKCPALLISADVERGGIITPESATDLQTHVPHLQVEHIAGAGHSIHREQFETYMDVIGTFLKQV